MKNIITIIILSVILLSCEKNGSDNVDTVQYFYVIDKNGNDLLNPENENHLDQSKIKTYYLINNEKVEGLGYFILTPKETGRTMYKMGIGLNTNYKSEGKTTYTFIEWGKDDTDTIKAEVMIGDSYFIARMRAFNDSTWNPNEIRDPIFTIVK